MIIDFGDVGISLASADAVTLELSTVFHPMHAQLPTGWPSMTHMSSWLQVDVFAAESSFAAFIQSCRQWAVAEAGSREEIVAVAYAYALRQLKYPGTDKELARTLIQTCISYFDLMQPQN
jgi:hypothetical protein